MDDGIAAKPGAEAHFVPDYNHIHLFDRESTNSLGYPEELVEGKEENNSFMEEIMKESGKMNSDSEVVHVHR